MYAPDPDVMPARCVVYSGRSDWAIGRCVCLLDVVPYFVTPRARTAVYRSIRRCLTSQKSAVAVRAYNRAYMADGFRGRTVVEVTGRRRLPIFTG